MTEGFALEALKVGLRNMFKPDAHFSICIVRDGLKLMRIMPPAQEMAALELLHCVHWRDMEPDFRDEVARRTLALFAHPDFTVEVIFPKKSQPHKEIASITAAVVSPSSPRKSFVQRLLRP